MEIQHYYVLPHPDSPMCDSAPFQEDYEAAKAEASEIGGIVIMETYTYDDSEMINNFSQYYVYIITASGPYPKKAAGSAAQPTMGIYYANTVDGLDLAHRILASHNRDVDGAHYAIHRIEVADAVIYGLKAAIDPDKVE